MDGGKGKLQLQKLEGKASKLAGPSLQKRKFGDCKQKGIIFIELIRSDIYIYIPSVPYRTPCVSFSVL